VLSRQAAEAVGMVGREKLLLCCRLFGCARRFGAHEGGDGRGHIVAAACLQLVTIIVLAQASYPLSVVWRRESLVTSN